MNNGKKELKLTEILGEGESERKWEQGDYLHALKVTLSAYDDKERMKPETAEMIYHLLKKEIDIINDKPENNRYLQIFLQWTRLHNIKGLDIIEELKKRISTVNFKTNTGKAKFENTKERTDIDINNATIDGKGVYKILELLAKYNIINKLKVNFLEGTTKATEGITINQEGIGKNEGIKLIKDRKAITHREKNKQEEKNPYEKMIIDMNSNLQNSEGPTSSTRMLYEICKKAGMIEKLPAEEQDTLERFVYFVDFAYRYKQKILGMDPQYIYSTLFGNYKKLRLTAIRGYLNLKTNPPKTGFEALSPEEAENMLMPTKNTNGKGEKKLGHTSFKPMIESKVEDIKKAIEEIDTLGEVTSLTYPGNKEYPEQTFIFDLENKIPLLEEAAPVREVGFVKLHKQNNEIYIRAYENLPPHFGGFTTENGNTGHFKLRAENLEALLAEFKGDEEVKDQIREQFRVNNFPKLVVKEGEKFEGIIGKRALRKEDSTTYGVKIKLTREGNKPARGLLHISNIKNIDELKKGEKIKVKVAKVGERGISLTIDNQKEKQSREAALKLGEIADGTIKNITDFGAFVKIGNTGKTGLLHKSKIDLSKIKIGDKITVRIISINDDQKNQGNKRIGLEIAQAVKKLEIKKMNTPANNGLQEKISKLPKDLKIKIGMKLSGIIENIKEGLGAFIKVERNADGKKGRGGLLYIKEIGGDEALKKLSIGQDINVIVKSIKNEEEKRINFMLPKKPATKEALNRLQNRFNGTESKAKH